MICLLTSCASTRKAREDSFVQVRDSIRWVTRDSVRIIEQKEIHDSIIIRDSVVVHVDTTGVVIYKERFRDRETYQVKEEAREVAKVSTDSVTEAHSDIQKTKEVYVKEPGLWDRLRKRLGRISCMFILASISVYCFRSIKKKER